MIPALAASAGFGSASTQPETEVHFTDNSTHCSYGDKACLDAKAAAPRRSDDFTPYDKAREFFFPDMGADPARQEYEELYGRPYPPPGNRQFEPDSPFTELRVFNDAFDQACAGVTTQLKTDTDQSTVSVFVPDSYQENLRVWINNDRILLSLYSSAPPSPYRIARRQNFAFANPRGIDPSTALVDRNGDLIEISFLRADAAGTALGGPRVHQEHARLNADTSPDDDDLDPGPPPGEEANP